MLKILVLSLGFLISSLGFSSDNPSTKRPRKTKGARSDRFFWSLEEIERHKNSFALSGSVRQEEAAASSSSSSSSSIERRLLSSKRKNTELAHTSIAAMPTRDHFRSNPRPQRQEARHIPTQSERVLDVPNIHKDQYLNTFDSNNKNHLAVALDETLYLQDKKTDIVTELFTTRNDGQYISSVKWLSSNGACLAAAFSTGEIEIWDIVKRKCLRRMGGHALASRVASFSMEGATLSSGASDGVVVNHDVRIREDVISKFKTHTEEICSLAWSPNGERIASGGGDKLVAIWDLRQGSTNDPLLKYTKHKGPIKALAWHPRRSHRIATGGACACGIVKIWNSQGGQTVSSIDTKEPITGLAWSPDTRELISSGGLNLTLWNSFKGTKLATFSGHTAPILGFSIDTATGSVVSAAAAPDSTMRFWNPFQKEKEKSRLRNEYVVPEHSRLQYKTRLRIR